MQYVDTCGHVGGVKQYIWQMLTESISTVSAILPFLLFPPFLLAPYQSNMAVAEFLHK